MRKIATQFLLQSFLAYYSFTSTDFNQLCSLKTTSLWLYFFHIALQRALHRWKLNKYLCKFKDFVNCQSIRIFLPKKSLSTFSTKVETKVQTKGGNISHLRYCHLRAYALAHPAKTSLCFMLWYSLRGKHKVNKETKSERTNDLVENRNERQCQKRKKKSLMRHKIVMSKWETHRSLEEMTKIKKDRAVYGKQSYYIRYLKIWI